MRLTCYLHAVQDNLIKITHILHTVLNYGSSSSNLFPSPGAKIQTEMCLLQRAVSLAKSCVSCKELYLLQRAVSLAKSCVSCKDPAPTTHDEQCPLPWETFRLGPAYIYCKETDEMLTCDEHKVPKSSCLLSQNALQARNLMSQVTYDHPAYRERTRNTRSKM